MATFTLEKSKAVLLIIDVQNALYPVVERGPDVIESLFKVIKGFQILNLPIFISEQYPKGLGETLVQLKTLLGEQYRPWKKTAFSCVQDPEFQSHLESQPQSQWILAGLETHICVFQTAKDLLRLGKQVLVLNDATSSRSIFDFSTGIAELRDAGARISSTETVLFELLKDSKAPEFKLISEMIRSHSLWC